MRSSVYMLVAVVAAYAAIGSAAAQQYPAKPIRLVVPLAPGGGADTLGRYIGKQLTESLGQAVVIENRAGGGLVGGEYVARAAPDGYTLIVGGSGQLVATLTHRKLHLAAASATHGAALRVDGGVVRSIL